MLIFPELGASRRDGSMGKDVLIALMTRFWNEKKAVKKHEAKKKNPESFYKKP